MQRPKSLTTLLKKCDPELKCYVNELEKINSKLHNRIAKLQAQNVDYQHEITALKKQLPRSYDALTDEQLEERIKKHQEKHKGKK